MKINSERIHILERVKSSLIDMLNQAKSSMSEAQIEANYHIGAMQSRYDTFKEEAQYLVAGQKIRIIKIENKIYQCDLIIKKLSRTDFKFTSIESGAFFGVKNYKTQETKYFLITPEGNGEFEIINNKSTLCVSLEAPIIKEYIGLSEGDEPEYKDDEFIEILL